VVGQSINQNRVFIDSNIWLYATVDIRDSHKTQIAKSVIASSPVIVVSTQVINEVCVNVVKNKFLDEAGIRSIINSFYAHYFVVEVSQEVIVKASGLRERYTLSYWDSVILAAAVVDGCTQVLSEDMQDGLHIDGQVFIVNPFKRNTASP
jgi:predicted nucleic acid-binding protein